MSEQKSTAVVVVQAIKSEEFQKKLATSLPKGISPDRFTRMTLNALQRNPDLLGADRDSLYLAILRAAETGLTPDGKKAAIVIFNTKVKRQGKEVWLPLAQFMPMVSGIVDALGEMGVFCDTEVVCANDAFEYEAGDAPKIMHKPAKLGQVRGDYIGTYAILRKNTHTFREVMDTAQVEQVRAKSKSPNSLGWKDFWSEMARKTVLRRCAKRVPMTQEDYEKVEKLFAADDETFIFGEGSETQTDPSVVAEQRGPEQALALEQTQGETLEQAVPKEREAVAAKKDSPARTSPPNASTAKSSGAPVREERRQATSSPASGSSTTVSSTKGPATNRLEPAPPARPRGLAAALATPSDSEDVF